MKTITIPALVLAVVASVAAMPANATAGPKAGDPQAEKTRAGEVQPHSHLQEKTGIMPQKKPLKAGPEAKMVPSSASEDSGRATPKPQSAAAKSGKVKADKDKTKHFHPRDGK